MDRRWPYMYYNRLMNTVNALQPEEIQPVVVVANYIVVKPGARWGWRRIRDFELVLIVHGRFVYETRGRAALGLQAGDVLCIPPGQEHVLARVQSPGSAVISCIHHELSAHGAWRNGDYGLDPFPAVVTHTYGDPAIHELFRRCSETFRAYSPYRAELLQTIAREIWLRLLEYRTGGPARRADSRIERMTAFLRERLDQPVTRRDLARAFSITPEHVNAVFKRELGVTPTQFVHRERVLRAWRLLREEGLSVKEAAARVGFGDAFYFSKVFKRILGVPPSRAAELA